MERIALPLQSEILSLYVLTLALPFVAMLAWFLFDDRYHQPAIILLMAIFFLMPGKYAGRENAAMETAAL